MAHKDGWLHLVQDLVLQDIGRSRRVQPSIVWRNHFVPSTRERLTHGAAWVGPRSSAKQHTHGHHRFIVPLLREPLYRGGRPHIFALGPTTPAGQDGCAAGRSVACVGSSAPAPFRGWNAREVFFEPADGMCLGPLDGYTSLVKTIILLLNATRVRKVLPLLLLLWVAGLVRAGSTSKLQLSACLVVAAFILVISILGMQLNALTDVELDNARKPELFAWLTQHPPLLRWVISVEVFLSAGLLFAAHTLRRSLLTWSLVAYGAAFTCYSFNVFTFWDPARYRLKVFWWGNFLSVTTGYFAIWLAGFALVTPEDPLPLRWFMIASCAALVDYGVFLNECATDDEEERAHGLKTLPALLGRKRTSQIALLLLLSNGCGMLWLSFGLSAHNWGMRVILALTWYTGIQTAACLFSLNDAAQRERPPLWERVLDSSFWLSRGGALAILVL